MVANVASPLVMKQQELWYNLPGEGGGGGGGGRLTPKLLQNIEENEEEEDVSLAPIEGGGGFSVGYTPHLPSPSSLPSPPHFSPRPQGGLLGRVLDGGQAARGQTQRNVQGASDGDR